jgi:hypothetical protein
MLMFLLLMVHQEKLAFHSSLADTSWTITQLVR